MARHTTIRLEPDEALVLFELLSRWSSDGEAAKPASDCFESPAEVAALLGVLADLEGQLAEPFGKDYEERLAAARERLALKVGDDFAL